MNILPKKDLPVVGLLEDKIVCLEMPPKVLTKENLPISFPNLTGKRLVVAFSFLNVQMVYN